MQKSLVILDDEKRSMLLFFIVVVVVVIVVVVVAVVTLSNAVKLQVNDDAHGFKIQGRMFQDILGLFLEAGSYRLVCLNRLEFL